MLPVLVAVAGCANRAGDVRTARQKTIAEAEDRLRAGEPAEAALLFAKLETTEDEPDLRLRESLAWLLAGETGRAVEVLENSGSDHSGSGILLKALAAWQEGDPGTALDHVDLAIAQDRDNAVAWALRGAIDLDVADYEDAVGAFAMGDQLLPDDHYLKATVLFNLAVSRFMQQEYTEADVAFSRYARMYGLADERDLLLAGAMAYAVQDHARAVELWQGLNRDTRARIASNLEDESELYVALAR
jgi:Flp pilus assembly protein TadD